MILNPQVELPSFFIKYSVYLFKAIFWHIKNGEAINFPLIQKNKPKNHCSTNMRQKLDSLGICVPHQKQILKMR